ncbi:MAG TPA: sulfotransferase [Solirubrobacteraceae bacterium]|nr:sulfotransferase [Solirubrobacteraceae bacterium]
MLRVVGAGLGRTGTNSLKVALERLLGGRCYHMYELIQRPGDTEHWERAAAGTPADWRWLEREFVATVDFPAAMFWRELAADSPEAVVLLSTRESAQVWWESFARTILPSLNGEVPADRPDWARRRAMNLSVLDRLTPDWRERAAAIGAYERHNDEVRRTVPARRLIDWQPGDGWEPICSVLGLDAPSEPFPHENTAADFQTRLGVTDPPSDQ